MIILQSQLNPIRPTISGKYLIMIIMTKAFHNKGRLHTQHDLRK